jgi:NTP pyrophosphatase (non-canonical NTP hydrolase)
MKLSDYQIKAREFSTYDKQYDVFYPILGLTGEAGEVANKFKKVIRDKDGVIDVQSNLEMAMELGDVLWYVSALATDLGYSLEDIAKMNINKLESRRERGTLQGSGDHR